MVEENRREIPRVGWDANREREFIAHVQSGLLDMHIKSASAPIEMPSSHGAFPSAILHAPPPIVLDANRVRHDLVYACRHRTRTTLVNAANTQLIRIFCAQHVIDEVHEHGAEWTAQAQVSRTDFARRWFLDYLPVIRVVPTDALADMLSPDEAARIATLRVVDPDDVPSVQLALLLGAVFLSGDTRALRAVYGPDVDLSSHEQWVEVLQAGGDAGELGKFLRIAMLLPVGLGRSLATAFQRTWARLGPWSLVPIALLGAAGAVLVKRTSDESKAAWKTVASTALLAAGEVYALHQTMVERFRRAAPDVPGWHDLLETNAANALLARACLHTLARSPQSDRSARELAEMLPPLGVPHGEAKVRTTLRARSCFFEAWRGRWQVGEVESHLRAQLATRADGSAVPG